MRQDNFNNKHKYNLFFYLLTPTLIYYIGNKITKKYKMQKEFNCNNFQIINMSPEIKSNHINMENLLDKEYGDILYNFAYTLSKNINCANLKFLYNINNLKISNLKSNFENELKASYSGMSNQINLNPENYLSTIYHELLHAASSYYDKDKNIFYSGFSQTTNNQHTIGDALNEGYTQLLTERYFNNGYLIDDVYFYEKNVASKIEEIIGKDKMKNLYFSADLYGLIEELGKYSNTNDVINFIKNMDFPKKYITLKMTDPNSKNMIISKLKEINTFLVDTFIKKMKIEYESNLVEFNLMLQMYINFARSLVISISYCDQIYNFQDSELLIDVYNNLIEDYNKDKNMLILRKR